MGWLGGRGWGGVGGKLKAGYTIHRYRDRAIVPSAQKQPQCTCQAKTIIGSGLTPHAALLVLPSGTVYPVVDRHEFTGSEKCYL